MADLIRRLLWWIFRRDFLVLSPKWTVGGRGTDFAILGTKEVILNQYLPVVSNYFTPEQWELRYDIHGNSSGSLSYELSTTDGKTLCNSEIKIRLPFEVTVQRDANKLTLNGAELPLLAGTNLPDRAPWLLAKLIFVSEEGVRMARTVGHRVRLSSPEQVGEEYFNGEVYTDYDGQASSFPSLILDKLARFKPLSGRFLDVGCATGLLVAEALKRGMEVEGVDFSDWAVRQASSRTNGRCRVLNLDDVSVDDFHAHYDVITMHSVIEHLADPRKVLEVLFEISRPGAIVYVQTLNADSLLHKVLGSQWEGFTDPTHKSPWITRDWLLRTSASVGFECIHVTTSGVWSENRHDDVWRIFLEMVGTRPASTLLEEGLGDSLELFLRRPEMQESRE